METDAHHRDKVGEMLALAEAASGSESEAHWRLMARQWAHLADQADYQDAFLLPD